MDAIAGGRAIDLQLISPPGTISPFPSLMRLLMAIMLNGSSRERVCLVLPDSRCIAEVCAVLASMRILADDFDDAQRDFLQRGFPAGAYVRSTADGTVYQVGESSEGEIKLKFIDKANRDTSGARIITREALLGYELTERRRPMAKPGQPRIAARPTPLDTLAGVRTLGNTCMIRNRVVLLGQMAEFERVLETVRVCRAEAKPQECPPLSDIFCWGAITDTGMSVEHPSGAAGQPLVAVARDPAQLRRIFIDRQREPFTSTIITSLVTAVLNRLDDVERVALQQRFVLFADARRRQEVARLKDNGWIVWELQPWELLRPTEAPRISGIEGLDVCQRAAAAELARNIPRAIADCRQMEETYDCFTSLGDVLGDPEVESDWLVAACRERCKALFFEVAGCLRFPSGEEADRISAEIDAIEESASGLRMIAGPEAVETAKLFLLKVRQFIGWGQPGKPTPKGRKLLEFAEIAHRTPGHRQVVVTGHQNASAAARALLEEHGLPLDCPSVNELRQQPSPFRVIAFNALWPEKFSRLVDPWPAASLALAGYGFEVQIYDRWLAQRERTRARLALDDTARAAVSGIPIADLPRKPRDHVAPTVIKVKDEGAEAFERISKSRERDWTRRPTIRVEGQDEAEQGVFCRFIGHSWTAFSDDHQVTKIVGAGLGTRTTVARVEVSELRQGDRIVMREHGQKDAIRQLAESQIGALKYSELKERAWLWRRTLQAARKPPEEIARQLAVLGVRRNIVTIRSWLTYPEMIGPRLRDDVLAICDAFAPSTSGMTQWDACWAAISELRSLHIAAGTRLSELISAQCGGLLLEPSEEEIRVVLDAGTAWILEIAHMDDVTSEWPAHVVNHLQWEAQPATDVLRLFERASA